MSEVPYNPWRILGVTRSSTPRQIRDAYVKLAWKAHPDRGGSVDKMALISDAYHTLTDRKRLSKFVQNCTIRLKACVDCRATGVVYKQQKLVGRFELPCTKCHGSGFVFPKEGTRSCC